MDKHQIGVNAGKVWKLLNDNKRWSYCDLKRASELSDRDLKAHPINQGENSLIL